MADKRYFYICRKRKCGCVMASIADLDDDQAWVAGELSKIVRAGMYVERVDEDAVKELLQKGIGCSCKKDEEQLRMTL